MDGEPKNNQKSAPDQGVCARCHQAGTGCCSLGKGSTNSMFGLTWGEVEAISQASGLEPGEFCVQDQAPPEFVAQASAIHPVFSDTMPGAKRIRLRVSDAGDCHFLGPRGCALPLEARPFYCRLYPFWFTRDGRLMVLASDTCLAQQYALSWREVLSRLKESEARLRMLFERLVRLAADHKARCLEEEPP